MALSDFFPWARREAPQANPVRAEVLQGKITAFDGLDDPALGGYLRDGDETGAGAYVSTATALRNMAVLRALDLICSSVAMTPTFLLNKADKTKAESHPFYDVLHDVANDYQSAYDFKSKVQFDALTNDKGGFAQIIRSRGRIYQWVPLDPDRMRVVLNANRTVSYFYRRPNGSEVLMEPGEVLHIRGLSIDGVNSLNRTRMAREAIGLARQAEKAAGKLFKDGVLAGGALMTDNTMSDEAYGRLRDDMDNRYTGAENAGRWMILEEGLKAETFSATAAESQHLETRRHQIEEVARAFGVPRPLLMMDDTSWGTGIEQLGIGFVRYGLQPWFTAWEQSIARVCLTREERRLYTVKFNAGALTRGSLKDQGEFFSRALGSGGSQAFMSPNRVLDMLDMPPIEGGDKLPERMAAAPAAKPKESPNEPA